MHSSISRADNDASFGLDYKRRLHQEVYEAGSHDRDIPSSEVTPNDVLGGPGRGSMNNPGSRFFRSLINIYKEEYSQTSRMPHLQWAIRRRIINEVLSSNGRFLTPGDSEKTFWKIVKYAEVHTKIQNRFWDIDRRSRSAKVNAVQVSPKDVMIDLDRSRLPEQDNFTLDEVEVTPDLHKAISDLNEADWREHLVWLASST